MSLSQSLLGFGLLALVVTLTPGLDTVLVLRQALRSRRSTALATAAGICVGALIWGIAAAAGLAALFLASPVASTVLRWLGVAFLLYLGLNYLWHAWRGQPQVTMAEAVVDSVPQAFGKGLLTDLLNPKMAVFYVTVLPLFLAPGYPPAMVGALLAGLHAVIAMAWFVVVILAAHRLRHILTGVRSARVIDATAGVAMLGFAAVLGADSGL